MEHSPLEKLIVTQLVKLPAFYGTWRFITMFTRACHWSIRGQWGGWSRIKYREKCM